MDISLSFKSDLEHVPGGWLGCASLLVKPYPRSVVSVVSTILLGAEPGFFRDGVDFSAELVSLFPALTSDVEETEGPPPMDEPLISVTFGVCACP